MSIQFYEPILLYCIDMRRVYKVTYDYSIEHWTIMTRLTFVILAAGCLAVSILAGM